MKYKIPTNRDSLEVIRILTLLLKNGYVFTRRFRIKTVKDVLKQWCDTDDWNYIITGYDSECKMVVGGVYVWDDEDSRGLSIEDDYITISVEDFLKLKSIQEGIM